MYCEPVSVYLMPFSTTTMSGSVGILLHAISYCALGIRRGSAVQEHHLAGSDLNGANGLVDGVRSQRREAQQRRACCD